MAPGKSSSSSAKGGSAAASSAQDDDLDKPLHMITLDDGTVIKMSVAHMRKGNSLQG